MAQAVQEGEGEKQNGWNKSDSAEAIEFIEGHLGSRFDEANARKLFSFYTIEENCEKLEAPDVRKLLLDILAAKKWPLVVPDEALDNVLYELCLNGKGAISWIEFKSFFVFLQELPIEKLFEIVTKLYTQDQLSVARLIHIRNGNINVNSNINNENKEEAQENNNNNGNDISYDRQAWKQIIGQMIEEAGPIFIYFLDSNSLLGLVIGNFSDKLNETVTAEIVMDGVTYIAEMGGFDCEKDVFPPITRSGGMKSKVARKIADSYLVAKNWDDKNLKMREKVQYLGTKAETKWKEIDEKYKVKEKVNEATKKTVNSIKTFDETHQITKRVGNTAKEIDDKYKIRDKVNSTITSIRENPTIQSWTSRLSLFTQNTLKTVDDISKETKQFSLCHIGFFFLFVFCVFVFVFVSDILFRV